MAQRRMVSIKIIDSAKFIKMPLSTQALYFHLISRADDDGVVEAFNVIRTIGSAEDDLKLLMAKQFVTQLDEDLVAYINDWNEHNSIRADRKIDSLYKELLLKVVTGIELKEKKQRMDRIARVPLEIQESVEELNECLQPNDNHGTTNGRHRLGKVRLCKVRLGKVRLGKDKLVEVKPEMKKEKTLARYVPDDDLNQSLINFVAFRKSIKKPMTDHAVSLLLNNLNKLSCDKNIQIEILNQSIVNGWQGVFELKTSGNNYSNGAKSKNNLFLDMMKDGE